MPRHQDQAEIVVGIVIRGIKPQDFAELLFRKVELFLGDVCVPEVVVGRVELGSSVNAC